MPWHELQEMPTIDIGGRSVDYAVVKGTSRRYTYFRFRPDLTLEVILPRGSKPDVDSAIRQKIGWIRDEYAKLSRVRRVLGPDRVMFGGRYLTVVFDWGADELIPDEKSGVVLVRSSDRSRTRELVRRWFLKETSAYVVRKVSELSSLFPKRPSRVDVREIGKWGYCTRTGRLSFSWQLVALPERLREYVVLHELTHLVEFNHSHAFRRLLGKVCPEFRDLEKELDGILPYDRLVLG